MNSSSYGHIQHLFALQLTRVIITVRVDHSFHLKFQTFMLSGPESSATGVAAATRIYFFFCGGGGVRFAL